MTPPEEGIFARSRGRRRSHHACLNCRRKKTRCPGEKPACSSCTRLDHSCSYPEAKSPRAGRSDERLQHLEDKLDFLLSGRGFTNQATTASTTSASRQQGFNDDSQNQHQQPSHRQRQRQQQQQQQQQNIDASPTKSYSPASEAPGGPPRYHLPVFDPEATSLRPDESDMAVGLSLYFRYCHRQPIWCFERDEVGDCDSLPEELACSILALTSRLSQNRDHLQLYGNSAKTLIMLRIANGTVDLTTIESLCLLSYSSFIDGNVQLGQFHLGLSFQLCRSALLDIESAYNSDDPSTQRKRRLFWSLQMLEQFYGRQDGLLRIQTDMWRPSYSSNSSTASSSSTSRTYATGAGSLAIEPDSKAPPLPRDKLGTTTPSEPGIWNTSVHVGWVWAQVRKYVSDCSHNILKEPWRHDSTYAKVLSDFMETENRIPMCHRYDSLKFYERKMEELKINRDYWATWLKEQFTYHAIPTVLNHPFLYIIGAQHNPNLGIPNTFWRRSSEQALLHATWTVRMIDMVVDKRVPLVDPFFGHAAAIAATVHLYYCCAAAPRLKHKSNTDLAKCRRFLKSFIPSSAACRQLDRNLEQMIRIAAGSENIEVEDWMPSKIYLSVSLMWEILQFNSTFASHEASAAGLLHPSLAPNIPPNDPDDTLEIIVATSPEISINTADGGQEAPTLSYKGPVPLGRNSAPPPARSNGGLFETPPPPPSSINLPGGAGDQIDTLTFNTTPWLYADSSQFMSMGGDIGYPQPPEPGNAWWEGDNFNMLTFNPI